MYNIYNTCKFTRCICTISILVKYRNTNNIFKYIFKSNCLTLFPSSFKYQNLKGCLVFFVLLVIAWFFCGLVLMASLTCKANTKSKFVLLLWLFVVSSVIKEVNCSELILADKKVVYNVFSSCFNCAEKTWLLETYFYFHFFVMTTNAAFA